MLPNWLYGKSKSKLQEILGGGGGGGASYTAGDGIDISNGVISFDPETTPAIDPSKIDGLDDDLAALAPKTAISNPNILHNPWFAVNQRAVTEVTVSNNFIADRWRVWSQAEFSVTRNSNGFIVIDNSSGDQSIILYQTRTTTYLTSLVGNKLTASVLLSDGTIYSGSITYDGSYKDYIDNEYIKLYAPSSDTNQILGLFVKPGASVIIKAFKLEVGEISTLHLDPRPEYATELAKCQRYFQRISLPTHSMLLAGITNDTSNATLTFPLPEMRSTPTYTASGIQYRGSSNSVLALTLNNVENHKGGFICVNFKNGNHTAWQPIAIRAASDSGGYIDFDAEL